MKAIWILLFTSMIAAPTLRAIQAPSLPDVKLSPTEIAEAIALGQSKAKIQGYRVGKKSLMGPLQYELGSIDTPFIRVARAARRAQETYQPFTAATLTKEVAGNYVLFVVPPISSAAGRSNEAEVVLVLPKKSTDLSAAIRPLLIATESTKLQNLFGAQWTVDTLVAYFDMSVLSPDLEFVVVFKEPISGGGGQGHRELRGVIAEKSIR